MNKYKKAAAKITNEHEFESEQRKLQKKYNEPENVIIKEKKNMTKFIVNYLVAMVRVIISIIIFGLATIGLLTIIYPNIRMELINILNTIYLELVNII